MEFIPFPKMARLSRDIVITEKLDGTNAQVHISDDGEIRAGSRTRWITPGDDNYGFAQWVEAHKQELMNLGPGSHFGEWWGKGIQRRYGLEEKRFSLFNVGRWSLHESLDGKTVLPECCGLVPVLYQGPFDMNEIDSALFHLENFGSAAAPGFMKPEGIVIFHTAASMCFKKLIENDQLPKGLVAA